MIITDYLLFGIAIVWLIAASITDIKKREVANWLSFSLIAIAIAIRAIEAIISKDIYYLGYGLVGMAVFLVLANAFYYTKVFAGGDAKLLIALGIVFATKPSFALFDDTISMPFLFVYLLNVLIVASIYGIVYSIVLAVKNRKEFISEFKKLYKQTVRIRTPFCIVILISLMVLFYFKIYELTFLIALIFIFPYLYIFVKSVENSCMLKFLSPNELTEGDWIVNSVKIGKYIINPNAEGLTAEEIKLIKKSNKKILVKQGIPFIPVFLIAAIVSIIHGNIFVILAKMLVGI